MLHVPPAKSTHVTVSAGTKTPPVVVKPIGKVVTRLLASAPSPVAHLVPAKACLAEFRFGELIHVGHQIVVGRLDVASADSTLESGALFDNECVRTDVPRVERECEIERLTPVVKRLPRRSVDEIDARVEPGFFRPRDDLRHPLGVMRAVERCEHVWYCRLHAETHTCESASLECVQILGIDRIGIRFNRHLGPVRNSKPRAQCVEHGDEVGGGQQRRRASAEKNSVEWAHRRPKHSGGELDFAGHLRRVVVAARIPQFGCRVRVEVAIATAHAAIRNMDIR